MSGNILDCAESAIYDDFAIVFVVIHKMYSVCACRSVSTMCMLVPPNELFS